MDGNLDGRLDNNGVAMQLLDNKQSRKRRMLIQREKKMRFTNVNKENYVNNEPVGASPSIVCTSSERTVTDMIRQYQVSENQTVFSLNQCTYGTPAFMSNDVNVRAKGMRSTLSDISNGDIVLTVASSGIAALLLPGGRTAHSRFCIPLVINEDSTCNIKQGSQLAELIIQCKLIIWDEAPMIHKYCFEALDRTMRDILRFKNANSENEPFGGKVIVFGGDFRQILPVIPRGKRQEIVSSALNSSYLWDYCRVLTLTRNMRLETGRSNDSLIRLREFSEWVLKIGDGTVATTGDDELLIEVPEDILIKNTVDPIAAIVNSTYPELLNMFHDPIYLQERAILAPTHEIVDEVNGYMLSLVPGEEKTYFSSDSMCRSEGYASSCDDVYTPEFLNSINCSGLPRHIIKLKVGVPVMLLRNIDQSSGLCNGTRLVITNLGRYVLGCSVISGSSIGSKVFVPRMLMTPSDPRLPFKFQRRQFPLALSFAMTINKSQGQSLSRVGLYLPRPIFSHGQLYVAISRVRSRSGLKILICNKDGQPMTTTDNVVYKEVFQNL